MTLKNTLNRLVRVVIDEAERNPAFEAALYEALGESYKRKRANDYAADARKENLAGDDSKRSKSRRPPAVINPVEVVKDGELALRSALEKLNLEQLRDIVAEYGMDTGRLVMKWVSPERVIDRIVEISIARAHKGDAFRKVTVDAQVSSGTLSVSEHHEKEALDGKNPESN